MAASEKQDCLPLHLTPVVTESCCTTIPTIKKILYKWVIINFTSCNKKTGECLKSSTFPEGNTGLKFYMSLYPNGMVKAESYVSVFLNTVSIGNDDLNGNFEFSLLNSKLDKVNFLSGKFPDGFGKDKKDWGFSKMIERESLLKDADDLLPNNKLTIVCEISIFGEPVNLDNQTVPECQLAGDLGKLFQSPKFPDVTLIVSGHEFQAHKSILAARSPVFAAMFEHNMKEKKLNRVEIVDFKPDVVEEMLRYIYSGKVCNLQKLSANLLAAADKYQLPRLKVQCENELMKDMSRENVLNILIVADLCRSRQLKCRALRYIIANAADIVETEGWEELLKNHSQLVTEAFKTMGNN